MPVLSIFSIGKDNETKPVVHSETKLFVRLFCFTRGNAKTWNGRKSAGEKTQQRVLNELTMVENEQGDETSLRFAGMAKFDLCGVTKAGVTLLVWVACHTLASYQCSFVSLS